MGAFLGISLWIALATVIPGLVTISTWYIAIICINPEIKEIVSVYSCNNDWIFASFAVTVMVLTQAFGILLEKYLIGNKKFDYSKECYSIDLSDVKEGVLPEGFKEEDFNPYSEYKGLYLLIAQLKEDEDSQGHLKRALAQFFLTNNTLISYLSGILIGCFVLLLSYFKVLNPINRKMLLSFFVYQGLMVICFVVSLYVAKIRFNVMGKALFASRLAHLKSK